MQTCRIITPFGVGDEAESSKQDQVGLNGCSSALLGIVRTRLALSGDGVIPRLIGMVFAGVI